MRFQIFFGSKKFKRNQKTALFSFVYFFTNYLFTGKQMKILKFLVANMEAIEVPNNFSAQIFFLKPKSSQIWTCFLLFTFLEISCLQVLHPPAKYAKPAHQLNCTLDISIHIQSHSHSLINWISNKLCLTSEPPSSVHSFIYSLVFIRSFTSVQSLTLITGKQKKVTDFLMARIKTFEVPNIFWL